jgi:nitrite reductase/ring-hydroxylating ferredoxin subunit
MHATHTGTVVGTVAELQAAGRLVGKVGALPVLVIWHDGVASAIEDRCPHLGFPLHRGTIESGMVTCHWHHARFDLASGCTLDPWADDATAFDVTFDDERVVVHHRPSVPPAERWERRLSEGLEHSLTLVIAKSVHALCELEGGEEIVLEVAYDFGVSTRGPGWGSGLTVLTCMANLLPHLDPADRPLALVHSLVFLARDTAGHPPRFAQPPLLSAGQPPARLADWYRRSVETRRADGAERTLVTAVRVASRPEVEQMMMTATTDHAFLDGGHTLDFTNKAFEALDHLGWDHAALLGSLVGQTCSAERAEESGEWNHPRDLAALATVTSERLTVALTSARGVDAVADIAADVADPFDVGALGWALLDDDPDSCADALVAAAEQGASMEQLARGVAYAAALRLCRFHLNNDPGDWDTVHHTFTYANAVHQSVGRCAGPALVRGIVHGAISVHLDRFLNVPAARLPVGSAEGLEDLAHAWDVQGAVDAAGAAVVGHLARGGSRAALVAALGKAVLQEDAGFHMYQAVEAGARQSFAWREGSEEVRNILVGVARFLAAHTPTRRELATISRTAVRLRRGDELFADDDAAPVTS